MKRSLVDPIPEIWQAADLLSQAADAHVRGEFAYAADLFRAADKPEIRAFTRAGWSNAKRHILHPYANPHVLVPDAERDPIRNVRPELSRTRALCEAILARDGFSCRYCGLPVIDSLTRKVAHRLYPAAVRWGGGDEDHHTAFQCLWLQYDHVIPHAAGGRSDLDNLVITCAVCNFGKENLSLEQLGLEDPRLRPPVQTEWDGLQRLLNGGSTMPPRVPA